MAKFIPSFVLFGVVLMQFASGALSMQCPVQLGLEVPCPVPFMDEDKVFCCRTSENIGYCCDIGDYIKNNTAIIAGILVGAIIVLIIITLCCCCFCSCCLLAKRRTHRGTILSEPVAYQPVVTSVPPPVYSPSLYPMQSSSMVHAPPTASQYPPPYPPSNSNQPPINPNYKF